MVVLVVLMMPCSLLGCDCWHLALVLVTDGVGGDGVAADGSKECGATAVLAVALLPLALSLCVAN